METTDIDSLISQLQKTKGALNHPEFENAFQALAEIDDAPDMSDLAMLTWILIDQDLCIWEEHGTLFAQGASDALVWKDGEWQDTALIDYD